MLFRSSERTYRIWPVLELERIALEVPLVPVPILLERDEVREGSEVVVA